MLSATVPLLVNTDSVFLHFMAYKGGHETRDAAVQWLLKRTDKLTAVEASLAKTAPAAAAYTVRQRSPEVDEQLVSTGGSGTSNSIKVYNASFHFAFELPLAATRDWSECMKLMHTVYTKIAHDVGMKLIQRRFLYDKNVVDATADALAKATNVIRQRAQAIASQNRSHLVFPAFSVHETRSFEGGGGSDASSSLAESAPQAMAAVYEKPRSLTRSKRSGSGGGRGGGGGGGGGEELDCDDENVKLLFQQPPPIEITSSVTIVYETEANSSDSGARKGDTKK